MAKIAYIRVSSLDQNTARQDIEADRVFEEKASGGTTDRPQLQSMLDYIREGDEVVVHEISRLARNLSDLQSIIAQINAKGASIEFLTEGMKFEPETENPVTTMMMQMLGSFAQFERTVAKQRQAEGIAKAKAAGKYKGRKPKLNAATLLKQRDLGMSVQQMAMEHGVTRQAIYRSLQKAYRMDMK